MWRNACLLSQISLVPLLLEIDGVHIKRALEGLHFLGHALLTQASSLLRQELQDNRSRHRGMGSEL